MDSRLIPQIKILEIPSKIGKKQIAEIEQYLKSEFESISLDDKKELLKNEAIYLYLSNFWNQYDFLCKRLESELLEELHFFLTFLRTLIDLYSELLFFLNQELRTQLGIYIGGYLLYHSDFYRFVAEFNSEDARKAFERYLGLMKDVLKEQNIIFPDEIANFSKELLIKNGFKIPACEQIFQKNYFKELSSRTFSLWSKDDYSNFYNRYYRVFSSYTHRSFTNQVDNFTKTEAYWIVQNLCLLSQLMLELVDKKIFNSKYESEYSSFLEELSRVHPSFLEVWNENKA